jgi:hypothetical protein
MNEVPNKLNQELRPAKALDGLPINERSAYVHRRPTSVWDKHRARHDARGVFVNPSISINVWEQKSEFQSSITA